MIIQEDWKTIECALKEGGKLHGFLSGGGLRVVHVRKEGKLLGYGEHPHVGTALTHLAEDIRAEARPYAKTYGPEGCYTNYLTGAMSDDSPLDAWLKRGFTFDAWFASRNEFIVELRGIERQDAPEGMHERVLTTGKTETFEARGYTFEVSRRPLSWGGSVGLCTAVCPIRIPPGKFGESFERAFSYDAIKQDRALALSNAFKLALAAPPVEVKE